MVSSSIFLNIHTTPPTQPPPPNHQPPHCLAPPNILYIILHTILYIIEWSEWSILSTLLFDPAHIKICVFFIHRERYRLYTYIYIYIYMYGLCVGSGFHVFLEPASLSLPTWLGRVLIWGRVGFPFLFGPAYI